MQGELLQVGGNSGEGGKQSEIKGRTKHGDQSDREPTKNT